MFCADLRKFLVVISLRCNDDRYIYCLHVKRNKKACICTTWKVASGGPGQFVHFIMLATPMTFFITFHSQVTNRHEAGRQIAGTLGLGVATQGQAQGLGLGLEL